jgi:hypothetical protein
MSRIVLLFFQVPHFAGSERTPDLGFLREIPLHPDYYASAQTIATQPFERGEFARSREIEDAIAGGSTSTEILFGIRSALQRLLESVVVSKDEAKAAKRLVTNLNRALR